MTWTSRKTFAALAKVSTQSEMTSGGSSLICLMEQKRVIAIAPSDASQSLVELLDEATWLAIHVAWPRKLKTCHFPILPNSSTHQYHQPFINLFFFYVVCPPLANAMQRHDPCGVTHRSRSSHASSCTSPGNVAKSSGHAGIADLDWPGKSKCPNGGSEAIFVPEHSGFQGCTFNIHITCLRFKT